MRGYAFIEYEHERDLRRAYREADGVRIMGRRVVVDVERGRTVKGWLPRRLGGGLGGTRIGGPNQNHTYSGRFDPAVAEKTPTNGSAPSSNGVRSEGPISGSLKRGFAGTDSGREYKREREEYRGGSRPRPSAPSRGDEYDPKPSRDYGYRDDGRGRRSERDIRDRSTDRARPEFRDRDRDRPRDRGRDRDRDSYRNKSRSPKRQSRR
ncbi:U1 small nuclear ribonucleoprotein 70 kDa [Smittium mucronatum]|uniref:U1 small nuclear ribonucleoprotein 70 kDa n=1 Tax=Smittium mucronatum TaxID=133383 RepID=A0A1R0GVM0_9FUNG|nr:U1 small nuclear ribonucleoprotein 70 kDa [Smittium mucronatum]OLY80966.1 U1 small nuclear ribonucleoprotein 70 kDa [Smittium mucronatum]